MTYELTMRKDSTPLLFCEREGRFKSMEEHVACEHSTGEVYDENFEPVSFICLWTEEVRRFQPFEDIAEGGRGSEG